MDRDAPLTRSSFRKLHPIVAPLQLAQLPARVWTASDWDRIRMGYKAPSMDEKWDIFTEGDTVFMHRSWTGYGIYQVHFSPIDVDSRKITSATVETDPEYHRRMTDGYDRVMIELILSGILLGEPAHELRTAFTAAIAAARTAATDLSQQAAQHSILGTRPDHTQSE